MRQFDVTALGELLIDFTDSGVSRVGNPLLEANPGGAPCNVLAMLAQLGRKTAFIGKVGDDTPGRFLKRAVQEAGIDARALTLSAEAPTTLAYVGKTPDGDRDFSFWRNPGADLMLRADEVPEELIADSRIFHFGSLSLTGQPAREALRRAVALAERHGCLLSFDPNLREPLWNSPEEARRQIAWGMEHCSILKIADNELRWFTGKEDFDEGIALLRERYPIPLILLTKGADGSCAYAGDLRVESPPFPQAETVDTTGAGDVFCACVLHYVLEQGIRDLRERDLEEMQRFANAAASLVTTRKGALRAVPSRKEVETFLAARSAAPEKRQEEKIVRVEQFVMAYGVEQDRVRAMMPEGFESLRPVLRINAEIRDEREVYVEFNAPAEHEGRRGWLNIAHWNSCTDAVGFERQGKTVRIRAPFLELTYTGTGLEGGCPAEKDNTGCYFRTGSELTFRPAETITVRKEFCDCEFAWRFGPNDAHGVSTGRTLPAFREDPSAHYPNQPLTPENAASIPCRQVLGAYIVRFERP